MRVLSIPALLGLVLVACRSMPPGVAPARYIVTTAPLGIRGVSQGLCVAVDPNDPQGIWWWEPGRSGCSSRSTGPGVFRAERATVLPPSQSGAIAARFRLRLIVGPGSTKPDFADIALVLHDDRMRAMASAVLVPTQRQNHLELLEQPLGP